MSGHVKRRSAGGLLFAVGTAAAAAGIGSLGSRRAPQVYPQLAKPVWAPPAGLFGPAWTVLYATIGVAGWRLWTRAGGRTVLALHATQLALNGAWPFTFFAGAQPHRRTRGHRHPRPRHRGGDRGRGTQRPHDGRPARADTCCGACMRPR